MQERTFKTPQGVIHYWVNAHWTGGRNLVFLPGLTADHRLFDKQLEAFEASENCLVWDAPGHGASRPFDLNFALEDKARMLHAILQKEGFARPVLIGQSMGGYAAQMFMALFPGEASGFVSIDSAPLGRQYVTAFEIWALRHAGPIYRMYPFEALKKAAVNGCAVTPSGRQLMRAMPEGYTKEEYAALAETGYRMLAEGYASGRAFDIACPAVLICGERDAAGSSKRYNRAWTKRTGIPLHMIPGAGHNANTDRPEAVNRIIWEWMKTIG